jgi:uncharacterized protein
MKAVLLDDGATPSGAERARRCLRRACRIGVRVAALPMILLAATGCDRPATTVTTTPNGSTLELPAEVQPVEFAASRIVIRTQAGEAHELTVELAEAPQQQERGLMYRTSMPEESGMLFIYPESQGSGFYMLNTRIPLSAAYADDEGVIFQIVDMAPCESPYAVICARESRPYRAESPFRYGLEVNQDYLAHRGIGIGDRIERVEGADDPNGGQVSEPGG